MAFKNIAIRSLLTLLTLGTIGAAWTQAPAPLPQPDLDLRIFGTVNAVVRQSDGSIVLGGRFDRVDGVPRSNLARLLPGGTLDPNWNAGVDGEVIALAADASDSIFVGGLFSHVAGQARANLAKVSSLGTVDANWAPSPNGSVETLALDGVGSLYTGGFFDHIGGAALPNLARVASTGTGAADSSWKPAPNAYVRAILVSGNDVFVAGPFTTIGGQPRNYLAKLTTAAPGSADFSWNPNPSNQSGSAQLETLTLDNSGLYVGGIFDHIGGLARNNLAKVATTGAGTVDANWNPSPNSRVTALLRIADDLYVGGDFSLIDGLARPHLAKVSAFGTGVVDKSWNPAPEGQVMALAGGGIAQVYVGGSFSQIAGQAQWSLAAINALGGMTPLPWVDGAPSVKAVARQHGGGTILGGSFLLANGAPRRNLLRLMPDGSLDPDWKPATNGDVRGLAVDSADAVYPIGMFTAIDGMQRYSLAKLAGSGAGSVDPVWNPDLFAAHFVAAPWTIAVDEADRIYLGGSPSLVRVANFGSGAVDANWQPQANGTIRSLLLDNDGWLYVGGCSSMNGLARQGNAKVSTGGIATVDPDWNPATGGAYAMALDGNGWLYAGTSFNVLNVQVMKVSTTGVGNIDPLWNPVFTTQTGLWIDSVAVANGGVYVAGQFDAVNGYPRNTLARLSSDTGSLDLSWNPAANGGVNMLLSAGNALYVAGTYTTIGGRARRGFAAFDTDQIFADGFQ